MLSYLHIYDENISKYVHRTYKNSHKHYMHISNTFINNHKYIAYTLHNLTLVKKKVRKIIHMYLHT